MSWIDKNYFWTCLSLIYSDLIWQINLYCFLHGKRRPLRNSFCLAVILSLFLIQGTHISTIGYRLEIIGCNNFLPLSLILIPSAWGTPQLFSISNHPAMDANFSAWLWVKSTILQLIFLHFLWGKLISWYILYDFTIEKIINSKRDSILYLQVFIWIKISSTIMICTLPHR